VVLELSQVKIKHYELYKIMGFFSLVLTTLVWGSSFALIKLSVSEIDPFTYTATRTLIATATLLPILVTKKMRGGVDTTSFKRGFKTGLAYSTGLLLQAAGTAYTTPSVSAFVTGLSSVHVHFYAATVLRSYSLVDLVSLILAITGLYVLTRPTGGFAIGEFLVLASTVFWAIQIILVSKYSNSSLLEFLTGVFTAGALYMPLALVMRPMLTGEVLVYLAYLALACSIIATLLQVLGQRYISATTASLIFLLEPVFATLFSVLLRLEDIDLYKVTGGALILISLYTTTLAELKYRAMS
jgi:drug/metabolite transporter (DMT)-like permease